MLSRVLSAAYHSPLPPPSLPLLQYSISSSSRGRAMSAAESGAETAARTPPTKRIVLGSSSQWRRRVLEQMYPGHSFDTVSPDIDEKAIRHPDPEVLPLLIAEAKLAHILQLPTHEKLLADCLVVTSDQVASHKGNIREKPVDEAEATSFLQSYRGSSVDVFTAVVVMNTTTKKKESAVIKASVHVGNDLSDEVIGAIIKKGDIFTCCGGFDVVDENFRKHVTKIDGRISWVEGFPDDVVHDLLIKLED